MISRLFNRTVKSLKQDGVRKTVAKFLPLLVDLSFDLRHGIETCQHCALKDLHIDSENKKHGNDYKATRIVSLRRILKLVRKSTPDNSVFVDFGCGKGRALLVAAETGFCTVRGVEFAPALSAIARHNTEKYKRNTRTATTFEITEGDATAYRVKADENVFFLFNPFSAEVLGKVVEQIAVSVQENPRKIWIIYQNPFHQHKITSQKFLTGCQQHVLCDEIFAIYYN